MCSMIRIIHWKYVSSVSQYLVTYSISVVKPYCTYWYNSNNQCRFQNNTPPSWVPIHYSTQNEPLKEFLGQLIEQTNRNFYKSASPCHVQCDRQAKNIVDPVACNNLILWVNANFCVTHQLWSTRGLPYLT